MKIAVNTRLLQKDKLDGIGWFSYESLKRVTQQHPEVEFLFIFDRPYDSSFIFGSNVRGVSLFPPTRHPLLYLSWFEVSLTRLLARERPDLFLSPDGYLSLSTSIPSLPVIHDINFHHRPADLPFAYRNYYNYFFPRFAKKATRIATVSEYSKADIVNCYHINPNKIDVLYNGANTVYSPVSDSEKQYTKSIYANNADYFIFIGMLHPRKNVPLMMRAYDEYRKRSGLSEKLLIVGEKMFMDKEINTVLKELQYRDDIIFLGRFGPEHLRLILASASALLFVPLFEGFGIPVVEAMYCDVPVICSNVTSLPEVAGEAALFADPNSVDSVANAMLRLSKEEGLSISLIEKGREQRQHFSWDKTAERLWACIENCL